MTKANPDYTASAVNLTNVPVLAELLEGLHALEASYQQQQEAADAYIPDEVRQNLKNCGDMITACKDEIKAAIEAHGSFQDVEQGWYAVKQRRVETSYTVEGCRKAIPQYAAAVIEEYVNEKKVEGLLKGGLITKEDVAYFAVKTPLAPAYIIR